MPFGKPCTSSFTKGLLHGSFTNCYLSLSKPTPMHRFFYKKSSLISPYLKYFKCKCNFQSIKTTLIVNNQKVILFCFHSHNFPYCTENTAHSICCLTNCCIFVFISFTIDSLRITYIRIHQLISKINLEPDNNRHAAKTLYSTKNCKVQNNLYLKCCTLAYSF